MSTHRIDPSGMCSIKAKAKDYLTLNFGWNNNCAEEDRNAASQPALVQAVKAATENFTEGLINSPGQATIGFLDGATFGLFSDSTGARTDSCPTVYNWNDQAGLYASMVPFPVSGVGKKLAAQGALVVGRNFGQKISQKGLENSFDRHAAQWFGRTVTKAAKLAEWEQLIVRASRSRQSVPWQTGSTLTYAHLARIEGKWFMAQYVRSTGELATAFVPNRKQVDAFFDILGK